MGEMKKKCWALVIHKRKAEINDKIMFSKSLLNINKFSTECESTSCIITKHLTCTLKSSHILAV